MVRWQCATARLQGRGPGKSCGHAKRGGRRRREKTWQTKEESMKSSYIILRTCASFALGLLLLGTADARAETTVTLWSHGADEPSMVAWVERAARNFEQKNPDVKVKVTWYQKEPLYNALKT